MPVLSGIFVYPVKGSRAVSRSEALVEPCGLHEDRRWMLVDDEGEALTQRTAPRLGRVTAQTGGDRLELSCPGMPALEIPFPDASSPRLTVRVWDDRVPVAEAGAAARIWFQRLLGRPCRLVYLDDPRARPVDARFAIGNDHVSLADGFPLLLAAEESLADLNARLDVPVSMWRFRPNLVISGTPPFDEDHWQVVRIGTVRLNVVKPCKRCVVTTLDPETAAQGKEPLRTLAAFRRFGDGVYFGENAIPEAVGRIRVGDPVEVLARTQATLPDRLRIAE